MESLFPFGLPTATSGYLVLYLLTLVLHAFFMSYTLAGTGYLAVHFVLHNAVHENLLARTLRDWLPFILSAAITAGIGPLLFIQILYKESFYTANLLLFHRWMAILPLLIIGFYLLYLLKSQTLVKRSRVGRGLVAIAAFGCFLFVAHSWTENHLLSLQSVSVWVDQYTSRSLTYEHPHSLARLTTWICGTVATMPVLLSWQLWFPHRNRADEPHEGAHRTALIALSGLVIGLVAAVLYLRLLDVETLKLMLGRFAGPYVGLGAVSWTVQVLGWVAVLHRGYWSKPTLIALTIANTLMLISAAIARETIRLAQFDLEQLARIHEQAARWSGFALFLFFLTTNTIVLVVCVMRVRIGLRESDAATRTTPDLNPAKSDG